MEGDDIICIKDGDGVVGDERNNRRNVFSGRMGDGEVMRLTSYIGKDDVVVVEKRRIRDKVPCYISSSDRQRWGQGVEIWC